MAFLRRTMNNEKPKRKTLAELPAESPNELPRVDGLDEMEPVGLEQVDIGQMATMLFCGWVPSKEKRKNAEHFGDTGDVFDILDF